ncbi:hypothetical protein STEG23_009397, partial [Scotinomys teguina]
MVVSHHVVAGDLNSGPLDPGGWGKTAVVRLYFIFPGICTLSLVEVKTSSPCQDKDLCLPSAGIKDVRHHCLVVPFSYKSLQV